MKELTGNMASYRKQRVFGVKVTEHISSLRTIVAMETPQVTTRPSSYSPSVLMPGAFFLIKSPKHD